MVSGTEENRNLSSRLEALRRRIIESQWSDPELLTQAADLCAQLGRLDEAVSMLSRALEIDRNHVAARALLRELASPEELRRLEVPLESRPLSGDPLGPFLYPLRGDVKWLTLVGVLIFVPLTAAFFWVARFGIFGDVFRVPVFLLTAGYLLAFLGATVRRGVAGSDRAPDWPTPDFAMFFEGFLALALVLVPMGPALVWDYWAIGTAGMATAPYLTVLLLLVAGGASLLPMVLLLLFVRKSFLAALSPVRLAVNIARAGGEYWRAALVFQTVCAGVVLLHHALPRLSPLAPPLVAAPVFYGLLACGRAAGCLYQSGAERLGWFASAPAVSSAPAPGGAAFAIRARPSRGRPILTALALLMAAAALGGLVWVAGRTVTAAGTGDTEVAAPLCSSPESALAEFFQAIVDDDAARVRGLCSEEIRERGDHHKLARDVLSDPIDTDRARLTSVRHEVLEKAMVGRFCVCYVLRAYEYDNGFTAGDRDYVLLVDEGGGWKLHLSLWKRWREKGTPDLERMRDGIRAAGLKFHYPPWWSGRRD
jgi:hypothetical protein